MDIKQNIIDKLVEFAKETKLKKGKVSLVMKDIPDTIDAYGVVVNAIDDEALAINYTSGLTEYCQRYSLLDYVTILPCYKSSDILSALSEKLVVPGEYIAITYSSKVVCTRSTVQQLS